MLRNHFTLLICLFLCLISPVISFAQDITSRPETDAQLITSTKPTIDGRLDDTIWQNANFASNFTQRDPNEGQPATERTEVAFMYDEDALYIALRMFSTDPSAIRAGATRRDNQGNAERVLISLDTYDDHRTAYSFGVTAAGTRLDFYHSSDNYGNRDESFNPIWTAKVHRGAKGWSAEMRIPFSQLRFNNTEIQEWGLNINRYIPSKNENVFWVYVPKSETGWSSKFGRLKGIKNIRPSRRLEILPYVASDATFLGEADDDNPFEEAKTYAARAGVDVKMGLGPNLTLDATINPDFGQVEGDPAEVNLSAFETFFRERRPFFTEGSRLLRGNGANYFYSRRIGQSPHGNPDADYAEEIKNTTILGAAKLTGRLSSGLSIGILSAVTAREFADTYTVATDETDRYQVEPLTGYGVVRLQQEFGANASTIGATLTGIRRDLPAGHDLVNRLNKQAFTGGFDWRVRFQEGKYVFSGDAGFSHVQGDKNAILRIQRSSAHYFQRQNAEHLSIDSSATSLSGYRVGMNLSKNSGEHWYWGTGLGFESPKFELNDAGRLGSADDIDQYAYLNYSENTPSDWYQDYSLQVIGFYGYDFNGTRTGTGGDFQASFTTKRFTEIEWQAGGNLRGLSKRLTRGGPLMETGQFWSSSFGIETNGAKTASVEFGGFTEQDEFDRKFYDLGLEFNYRPSGRWQFSTEINWSQSQNRRQFIGTAENGPDLTFGTRYQFALIDQTNYSLQFRLNYVFKPGLTLELYGEPFAASGEYHDHAELAKAKTSNLRTYGTDGSTVSTDAEGNVTVTDGLDEFTLSNRDFNFISFRSNAVLRWEWLPGSTLFLVWQQDRSSFDGVTKRVGVGDLFESFSATGNNFVALKITYWFPAG